MLYLLIPVLSILSLSAFYAFILKRKLVETFFLAIATITAILFFFGLLNFKGCLLIGYYFVLILSIFSCIFVILQIIKNKSVFRDIGLSSGIFFFFLFLCFSIFLNYKRMFIQWDEIGDWGMTLKSLYTFDALGTYKEATALIYQSYPPATNIIQYFWGRAFPVFTEYPAYIAMNMLFFSLITPFLRKITYKNILAVITFSLIPLLFGFQFYSSLYVDCILGILFGSSILFYYIYGFEKSFYGIIILTSSLFTLTLIKDTGFILSGIAIFVFILDMFFFKKDKLRDFVLKRNTIKKRIFSVILLLSPLLACLLAKLLWQIHLNIANITPLWNLSSIDINSWISGNLKDYQETTLGNFVHAFIFKPIYPLQISFLKFLFIFITAGITMAIVIKKKMKSLRVALGFISITLGSFVYCFILLIFYMFVMWDYESLILASYERYIFTFILGMCIMLLLFLLLKSKNRKSKSNNIFFEILKTFNALVIIILAYLLIENTKDYIKTDIIGARNSVNTSVTQRALHEKVIKWEKYIKEPGQKVYLICQGDNGLDKLKLIYNLYPVDVKMIMDYSVSTTPYFPELNDPWTKIISPSDWGKYVIDNYSLVYIFEYDEKFQSLYGSYFDQLNSDTLYKVETTSSGALKLVSIDLGE